MEGLNELKSAIEQQTKVMEAALAEAQKQTPARHVPFPVEEEKDGEKAKSPAEIENILQKDSTKLTDFEREIHDVNDKIVCLAQLTGVKDARQLKSYDRLMSSSRAMSMLRKAMDVATSTEGYEWVPTAFSSTMFDKVYLDAKVAALHPRITMPTSPYTCPTRTSFPTAYYVPESKENESTKIPASDVGTSNFTFTAKKIAARTLWSEELSEDSVLPVIGVVQSGIALSLAQAIENAIINGDTTATHQDSDVTSSTDVKRAWKGYRKWALALTGPKVDCATFSTANLHSIRTNMGVYGVLPSNLAWVLGLSTYGQLLALSEVLTVDKYGAGATILSGEQGQFMGIPIIVSEFIKQDINASGVYDGTTKTKTSVQLVYRPGFVLGVRRDIRVRVKMDEETEQQIMIASTRLDFQSPYASTEKIVGIGYNIAS